MNDTLGQPVIGSAGSEGVTQGAGYWYGAPAVAPAVAPEVDIARTTGGAELTWTHITANANGYEVWWSTAPYSSPGAEGSDHATVTMPPWTYTHTGAPGVNYYYVVTGRKRRGAEVANLQPVGTIQLFRWRQGTKRISGRSGLRNEHTPAPALT